MDERFEFMRAFLEEVERIAYEDPERFEKPVVAMRQDDVIEDTMIGIWGDNWKDCVNVRHCIFCNAAVIVRPVFADNTTIICIPCAPKLEVLDAEAAEQS